LDFRTRQLQFSTFRDDFVPDGWPVFIPTGNETGSFRHPCRLEAFPMEPRHAGPRCEADPAGLSATLGHEFRRPELLQRALTHRSLSNELLATVVADDQRFAAGSNERLEFLGDAVLGLVIGEALFELHPDWREGELTVVRSQLVSRQHMARVAAAINLGSYLRLSRVEEGAALRRASTVLSNTMEAVLGALYLDGGLEPVKEFARRYVMGDTAEQLAAELRSGKALGNYKSALQEHVQAAHLGTPIYKVRDESGPDHRKRFLVEVRLVADGGEPGKPLARGSGNTKKDAEQDAARRALTRLLAAAAKAAATTPLPNGNAPQSIPEP
jgi:ribonuclease III